MNTTDDKTRNEYNNYADDLSDISRFLRNATPEEKQEFGRALAEMTYYDPETAYTPALHDLVTLRGSTTLQYRVARVYPNDTVDIYASGTMRRMNVALSAISPVVKVNGK